MLHGLDAAGIRPDDESVRGDVLAEEQLAGGIDADVDVHHVVVFHGLDDEFEFQGSNVPEAADAAADQCRFHQLFPEDAEHAEYVFVQQLGKLVGAGGHDGAGDAADEQVDPVRRQALG